MKLYKPFFKEDIVGFNAFVYHRTKSEYLDDIVSKGFSPGSGAMYGKGLYSTYDLDSQLKEKMERQYGNIIIKFKVNLHNCLILDYDQAMKVYGKEYTLMDQLKNLNIIQSPRLKKVNIDSINDLTGGRFAFKNKKDGQILIGILDDLRLDKGKFEIGSGASFTKTFLISDIEELYSVTNEKQMLPEKDFELYSENLKTSQFTSNIALKLLDYSQIANKINGIVFTGQSDGRVCVIYNTDIAVPVSYTLTSESNKVFYDIQNNNFLDLGNVENDLKIRILKDTKVLSTTAKDPKAWIKVASIENIRKSLNAPIVSDKTVNPHRRPLHIFFNRHTLDTIMTENKARIEYVYTKKIFVKPDFKVTFKPGAFIDNILTANTDQYDGEDVVFKLKNQMITNIDKKIAYIEVLKKLTHLFANEEDTDDYQFTAADFTKERIQKYNIRFVDKIT